jgi:hypothetical protein
MGLATPEAVGTLDALGVLNLDDPGPWPGEPQGKSAWTVDWDRVEEPLQREGGPTCHMALTAPGIGSVTSF